MWQKLLVVFIPTRLAPKQPPAKPAPPHIIHQKNKKKQQRTKGGHGAKPLEGQTKLYLNL